MSSLHFACIYKLNLHHIPGNHPCARGGASLFVALLAAIVELPGHSNCERELGDGDRHGDEGGAVSDEGEGGYGKWRRSYNRSPSFG